MLEFMVSASPEFFETATPETIADWKKTQVEFLQEQFGTNLKLVMMHVDESSPHMHIFISTELKSEKKYKNQKGEFFKTTWSLNAKRFDPEFLVGLHDAHAAKNDRFGLLRGVEGSTAEHVTMKDYTKRLNRVLKQNYSTKIAGKLDDFFAKKTNIFGNIPAETAKKVLVPFLTELKKDLECLKYHIKDKAKRNKLLEEEAKKLKGKEKQIDELLTQATAALKSKNDEIVELSAANDEWIKASFSSFMKNTKLRLENAMQQKEIIELKKKLSGFQFK